MLAFQISVVKWTMRLMNVMFMPMLGTRSSSFLDTSMLARVPALLLGPWPYTDPQPLASASAPVGKDMQQNIHIFATSLIGHQCADKQAVRWWALGLHAWSFLFSAMTCMKMDGCGALNKTNSPGLALS
eukprot:scaffold16604_cov18-Tisochrysis_lutea.AAC.1